MKLKNKMKRPSYPLLITIVIVVALIAYLLYQYLAPRFEVKPLSYFEERLIANAKSSDDNNFFWFVGFDSSNFRINVIEDQGGVIHNYAVVAYPSYISKLQGVSSLPLSQDVLSQLGGQKINSYLELLQLAQKPGGVSLLSLLTSQDQSSLKYLRDLRNGFALAKINPDLLKFKPEFINYPPRTPSFFDSYIFPLIPSLIFVGLLLWGSLKIAQKTGSGGNFFNPGKNQAIRINKSNKKFSDIAGNAEVKEEIVEFIDYLKNPAKYAAAGAKIPKGILLGGPPGTGKTLLAKATAGEAGVPFFFISASNFVELYVGVGAKRVRELFKDARAAAPAIIFIDELDAIGRSRGSGIGGGNDEREQTLNQMLVEMDGMVENSGLLVIAATNRSDVLDPALQRPGRFDRSITVNLPDVKEREEILRLHAKGKRISKTVTLENVARRTPGFSGAQLENIINEATLLSVREQTEVITSQQIDEAIDRVIGGPAKKNRVITEKERIMVAYHEAGHAVVGIRLGSSVKVQKITIVPRGQTGGYNLMIPEEEKYNSSKTELLTSIATFMGGRAAEEVIYGPEEISTGAANDIDKATKIARRMVTEFGMSSLGPIQYEQDTSSPFLGRDYMKNASFSSKVGHEIDIEVRKFISDAYDKAREVIKQNLKLLELIKDTLLEKETIVYEEIQQLATTLEPLPKIEQASLERTNAKDVLNELMGDQILEDDANEKNPNELESSHFDDN
ncbi:ATP-dependent zinc metalloprotease FtsH [Mesomycoplasma bovoculi]|uniref:ATP-dependent zinc metalloprotease FtsH n=1 Tax=Mesomycoplasma bovoculi M165/69 TaxID=743966 RepID=W5USV6_9BACT|nr:ATP-dependent zinc metalloprotease FtsH [Mesomycoplasma bovoculi]AHH45196.1 cell division protein [Mesomycoplasma bovoculi M165/69]